MSASDATDRDWSMVELDRFRRRRNALAAELRELENEPVGDNAGLTVRQVERAEQLHREILTLDDQMAPLAKALGLVARTVPPTDQDRR